MIETTLSVTDFVSNSAAKMTHSLDESLKVTGIYLSSKADKQADKALIGQLCELYSSYTGSQPEHYLLLDLAHQGRVDARLYADRMLTQFLPLNMIDECSLYPDSSKR